ncbi:MAG: hypothetical protein GY756_14370 [bacterium]|nr:hypothetical protein [bacterium]
MSLLRIYQDSNGKIADRYCHPLFFIHDTETKKLKSARILASMINDDIEVIGYFKNKEELEKAAQKCLMKYHNYKNVNEIEEDYEVEYSGSSMYVIWGMYENDNIRVTTLDTAVDGEIEFYWDDYFKDKLMYLNEKETLIEEIKENLQERNYIYKTLYIQAMEICPDLSGTRVDICLSADGFSFPSYSQGEYDKGPYDIVFTLERNKIDAWSFDDEDEKDFDFAEAVAFELDGDVTIELQAEFMEYLSESLEEDLFKMLKHINEL